MSRRCKPGQRAKIIGVVGNNGKIVLVVRPYFGEVVGDGTWPNALYPWVVTSLGSPLHWTGINSGKKGTTMTAVFCDTNLEPLDDDDDGLTRSTEKDKPIKRPKAKQAPKKAPEVQS